MTLWDQRDDPFQPHKGYMISTTMETTTGNGELDSGGATPNGDAAPVAVDPLWQGHRRRFIFLPLAPGVTLAQNMKSGWIQSYDSMGYVHSSKDFSRGTKTIRGFNEDQILPVDDEEWLAWKRPITT